MPRRRKKHRFTNEYFNELTSLINSEARVALEGGNVVIDVLEPYSLWSKLQEYCEEIVVGDYQRMNISGDEASLVEVFCASKRTRLFVKIRGVVNLLALTPVFLLYDKKACIKGLKAEASVL